MRTIAILMLCLAAAPAAAQVIPPPDVRPFGAGVTVGDVHRYEMERLRGQAAEREAFARQSDLDARQRVLDLQSTARPPLADPGPYRTLRSPEEERRLREAATARRETVTEGVGQIDGWLDRPPR